MDAYKEFQGKTLDGAIEAACSYFNSAREKLEIEIVNDAKTGIFGLVGAKKAKIRARRMQVAFDSAAVDGAAEAPSRDRKRGSSSGDRERKGRDDRRGSRDQGEAKEASRGGERRDRKSEPRAPKVEPRDAAQAEAADTETPRDAASGSDERRQPRKAEGERTGGRSGGRGDRSRGRGTRKPKPVDEAASASDEGETPAEDSEQQTASGDEERKSSSRRSRGGRRRTRGSRGRGRKEEGTADERDDSRQAAGDAQADEAGFGSGFDDDMMDEFSHDPIPEANLEELDQEALVAVVNEVVAKLITPVIGETPVEASIEENRVKVTISSGDNSGLLIGREGQTLAAFQYLTNRIVAKRMGVAVRVQLDTGDYRERQDDKLREIALHLADKAKTLGKPQSTRPLSSYHRRIVHLALQGDDDIQTRSKGDGPLKRVIIGRKRKSA